jgi:hypothetical protein
MQFAVTALSILLPQLPIIGVMVVGIIIAVARWQKHPRVSVLLVIALSLEIASAIIYPLLTSILITSVAAVSDMTTVLAITGLGGAVLRAVLFGLILWAAFGWRTPTHER